MSREDFVIKLKEKIDLWNADLDRLQAKADQTSAEARVKYQQQIEDLQEKRRALEEKIAQLRGAGEGAWEDIRTGMEIAWGSMSEALSSALQRFK
jgi:predicted  nucleic acid-binding Zn-ribbon protein